MKLEVSGVGRNTYLGLLERSLLQDLLDHVVLLRGAKLILKLRLGGSVELSLCALPIARH